MKYLLIGFIFMQSIAIGPNDVKPGDWFTPNSTQEQVEIKVNSDANITVRCKQRDSGCLGE